MPDAEDAIAWTATPYRSPVLTREGSRFGTAESLLGDEEADIFHGIAVKRDRDGKLVEVAAEHVKKITSKAVLTDIADGDVPALEPYRDERWFHVGWGGLFRKRPEWDETSTP